MPLKSSSSSTKIGIVIASIQSFNTVSKKSNIAIDLWLANNSWVLVTPIFPVRFIVTVCASLFNVSVWEPFVFESVYDLFCDVAFPVSFSSVLLYGIAKSVVVTDRYPDVNVSIDEPMLFVSFSAEYYVVYVT